MSQERLVFGTAGLRAVMGPELNQINALTVSQAGLAIAGWLKAKFSSEDLQSRPVVIGWDARHQSDSLSLLLARLLLASGLKVERFADYCATPLLAYAIRPRRALCGLMFTASHNSKEYNGLKLYDETGIQIGQEDADFIHQLMLAQPMTIPEVDESLDPVPLAENITGAYIKDLEEDLRLTDLDPAILDQCKIAYSPMQGTGGKYLPRILKTAGFNQVFCVPSQLEPDPDFSNVPQPNPEYPETLDLLAKLGEDQGVDLALATDPDADRLAVMLADDRGKLRALTGNETGALLFKLYYDDLLVRGELPENPCLVKSLVTDNFAGAIARDLGVNLVETMTGFKNICGKIREFEHAPEPQPHYLMGYEESIGYAIGQRVLDKDGINAAAFLARSLYLAKSRASDLATEFQCLQEKYGYYLSKPIQLVLTGDEGRAQIRAIIDRLRNKPALEVAGVALTRLEDYDRLTCSIYDQGNLVRQEEIKAESYNLLRFFYQEDYWFACRPSGTEPKLKFYLYAHNFDRDQAQAKLDSLAELIETYID